MGINGVGVKFTLIKLSAQPGINGVGVKFRNKWGRGKIYIYKAKPLTAADDHGPATGIYSCGQTFQGVVGCKVDVT